jgi:hypothetical protein
LGRVGQSESLKDCYGSVFDGVDLHRSWVIGDGVLELVAGWRAGCRIAGIGSRSRLEEGELSVEPELLCPDLASVLAELLRPAR